MNLSRAFLNFLEILDTGTFAENFKNLIILQKSIILAYNLIMIEKIENAAKFHHLDRLDIIRILATDEFDEFLFKTADSVRKKYKGDSVHIRGIIEFSNICKQNCKYCGIRKDNPNAERYRLSPDEIILFAQHAKEKGFRTIVLQSGEDGFFSAEKMAGIIKKIKSLDMAVTLSLGEKTTGEYEVYKKAGADRYLLRIETTDKTLYGNLHPNMSFENRVRCLKDLKKLGYETGTGILVGLPGQSIESIADDILFFKNIDADMIGLGPFIPAPDTPLSKEKGGTLAQALKVMAITRLLLPDINIPATTAMETLHPQGRLMALQCGANVIMPNVTESDYRKKYLLYPGKIAVNTSAAQNYDATVKMIESIGRKVSITKGFRRDT